MIHGTSDAGEPRAESVLQEPQRLGFRVGVGEATLYVAPDHVRGDAKDTRDLLGAEAAGLDKLGVLVGDPDGGSLQPFLKNQGSVPSPLACVAFRERRR